MFPNQPGCFYSLSGKKSYQHLSTNLQKLLRSVITYYSLPTSARHYARGSLTIGNIKGSNILGGRYDTSDRLPERQREISCPSLSGLLFSLHKADWLR